MVLRIFLLNVFLNVLELLYIHFVTGDLFISKTIHSDISPDDNISTQKYLALNIFDIDCKYFFSFSFSLISFTVPHVAMFAVGNISICFPFSGISSTEMFFSLLITIIF